MTTCPGYVIDYEKDKMRIVAKINGHIRKGLRKLSKEKYKDLLDASFCKTLATHCDIESSSTTNIYVDLDKDYSKFTHCIHAYFIYDTIYFICYDPNEVQINDDEDFYHLEYKSKLNTYGKLLNKDLIEEKEYFYFIDELTIDVENL